MIRQDNFTKVALPEGALDVPLGFNLSNFTDWTDYGIWGVLLFDQQPPWFTLIECMHILYYRHNSCEGELFKPPSSNSEGEMAHEFISYKVPINKNLRHLLFRDLEATRLGELGSFRPTEQWKYLVDQTKNEFDLDLSYLEHSFTDVVSLHRALDLLRSTEVEAYSSKRWTSRHLLPLGPDMIFADVHDHKFTGDRHFMRRTGEILYMMLGRSQPKHRETLSNLLKERLLDVDNIWNKLARKIRKPEGGGSSTEGGDVEFKTGYLPFLSLNIYNSLAKDWISLLSLDRIQIEDLMDPLMRLSTLHLVIYIIYRTEATMGLPAEKYPPFVFDLSGLSRRNPVQKIAKDQYGNHVRRPRKAIDAYIDDFAASSFWKTDVIDKTMEIDNASKVIRSMFLWPKKSRDMLLNNGHTVEKYLAEFRASALANKSHSIWSAIASQTRGAGMILARPKAGTWYAPNDALLEALVLANVTIPVELGVFLEDLFKRYRIVIGQEQARVAFHDKESVSLEKLKINEQRLEERLRILGYIDRKSDACAFVVNPFYRKVSKQHM